MKTSSSTRRISSGNQFLESLPQLVRIKSPYQRIVLAFPPSFVLCQGRLTWHSTCVLWADCPMPPFNDNSELDKRYALGRVRVDVSPFSETSLSSSLPLSLFLFLIQFRIIVL